MEELIRAIVNPLVDKPDAVKIACEETEQQIVYTLTVSKEDMGRIIGKNGSVASAIRTILSTAGKNGKKVRFLIRE